MSQPKNIPKSKNIYQPNLKVFQSPSQKYQNLIYSNNNNNNLFNYNIKVSKLKNPPKEKIIEGELNFNDKKIYHNKISNHSKNKKIRNKPRKSPIPLPKDYKPSNFPYQKLFNNNYYMHNSNNLKPKSAYPKANNNSNNINNKNVNKQNSYGINSIFPSNKTYNTFNIFKKNLERTHSPLLRTSGAKNGMNFVQKGTVKSRYISKSPILSKGSIFNRYKMYGFIGHSNIASSNSISNNQKSKKKTPIKNNKKKSSGIQKHNNINQAYNVNNLRSKGPTFISGELIQDSSNNGKININRVNNMNNQNVNQININKNRNNNNNNEYANIIPVYNPNNLKIDSNNALLNIHAEVNINNKEKENQKKNKQDNENKIRNNENINNDNFNNIRENKNEESKKSNKRSQSTGIINPLQKSYDKEDIKEQKLKKEKKIPVKENEIPIKENIKVRKIIKDILPYTHVGFDGEEPKENNQDNYFIYKNFMNKKDYIYMSVCDGHGAEGHFVSDFIKETLPYDMSENLKNMNILTENENEKNKIYQVITETFIFANEKLVENEEINSLFSGSTCVSVIYTPEKLIVPNIGDSRAVLGRLINKKQ